VALRRRWDGDVGTRCGLTSAVPTERDELPSLKTAHFFTSRGLGAGEDKRTGTITMARIPLRGLNLYNVCLRAFFPPRHTFTIDNEKV
jgi:hypothetical protein